jgi:hypothetical protein
MKMTDATTEVIKARALRDVSAAQTEATAHELLECLEAALEFVSAYEDVNDGPYGEPVPNVAMQLAHAMRLVIAKAKGETDENA